MGDVDDLVEETKQLLEPGEIDLVGVIVETPFTRKEELEMIDRTIELGEMIAEHLTDEPTYVYSGVDDPEFSTNQHQCLTIADDDFVWECQQLLRNGTFDIVYYYEATDVHDAIIDQLSTEHPVTSVVPDGT